MEATKGRICIDLNCEPWFKAGRSQNLAGFVSDFMRGKDVLKGMSTPGSGSTACKLRGLIPIHDPPAP